MKKRFPLYLLPMALAWPGSAEDLSRLYAGRGELILVHLASAPFPHPKRAEGHKYKDEFFPAEQHYSDNSVAIFIPKGFREIARIDFVVHFHGWRNNVQGVLQQYGLIDQLVASKRNTVLVVPQGPRNAPDSFGGKLEDAEGFKQFMNEVTETLRNKSALHQKDFTLGNIILSAHSGGYQVVSSILDRGGLTGQVKEVWLFDALYAHTDQFLTWFDKSGGRLINLYTEHGGTKIETDQMMVTLKQRGVAFFSGKEGEVKETDLRTNHLLFLYTGLEHNAVLDKHQTFRDFLKTSCLGETGQTPSP